MRTKCNFRIAICVVYISLSGFMCTYISAFNLLLCSFINMTSELCENQIFNVYT